MARRLLGGDAALAANLASALLVPQRNNFVERPWGGTRIRAFKRCCDLPDQLAATGAGLGEAFEIAAFDADKEARQFPSRLRLSDGSGITLPELLAIHGEIVLGARFVARHGPRFPLLPKTLDIRELLSVQGHPEGNTELYIIIDAEPGATIRLGFARDVEAAALAAELERGLRQQRELLTLFPQGDAQALQSLLKPWLADRAAKLDALAADLRALGAAPGRWSAITDLLAALKTLYWRVLDALNVIPVAAGQVIYNATPARLLAGGREASAEVHALGNPEGREILALEVRRPGPTFRAWDNVRFPVREVDVAAALGALNLRKTSASEFLVEPTPVTGRPGVYCSVDTPHFRVEHLRPDAQTPIAVPAEPPHCLHVLAGEIDVVAGAGRAVGELARGDSALVPIGVGAYAVRAQAPADVVKVSLDGR